MPLCSKRIGRVKELIRAVTKGISQCDYLRSIRWVSRVSMTRAVSVAGLIPVVALAQRARLIALANQHLTVHGGAGSAAGAKVGSLVAGMLAGADSIADMGLLQHGAMDRLFVGVRGTVDAGHVLRSFRFGHVRQLDAVAARFTAALDLKLLVELRGFEPLTPSMRSSPDARF
jgi:hypothetical protein